MHADFPPDIDDDASALDEKRDADNRHQEMGHVSDGKDVHKAEVAADVDDVWDGSFMPFAKFESAPAMHASVNVDGKRRQTESEAIDEPDNPQLECPREEA